MTIKEDLKIFGKFFLYNLKPKKIVRKSYIWLWLGVILTLIMMSPLIKISINLKFTFVGIILLLIAILQLYLWYKSGEHRGWWRKLQGIPSKSMIISYKENHNQTEQNSEINEQLSSKSESN